MTQREITAKIAYQLFEHRGYTHGRAADDWFTAEAILELCASRMTVETPSQPRPATRSFKRARLLADTASEKEVLAVLKAAVESDGRAAVAAKLGYASTGSVGKLLKRKRALSESQLDRIRSAFAFAAPQARAA